MGKIRVKTLGDEELEQEQKKEAKKRKEAKKLEKAEKVADMSPTEEEVTQTEQKTATTEDTAVKAENTDSDSVKTAVAKKQTKTVIARKEKFAKSKASPRSGSYKTVMRVVDRKKVYPLQEALELLPQLKRAQFDETVELHINTIETGVSGSVTLPHGTGKKVRVAVADDQIIAQIEKGKIDFDVLLAEPVMMPKLAKVARVLGPKGLMPNPKNGTITSNPAEAIKKFDGGQIHFKTESKSPIMHLSVGKVSFGEKKIEENINALFSAIPSTKVRNITLKLTMSPGIKIAVS